MSEGNAPGNLCGVSWLTLLLLPLSDGDAPQPDSSPPSLGRMETEELSTSFSTAGVTEETEIRSRTGPR